MTRAPLSPVEQQLYHFLLDFLAEHTFQPSVREISGKLKIPSTKSVVDLLASLEKKGYVRREPGRSRGVTLVGFAGGAGTIPVPVMRLEPGQSELRPEDHLTLDRRLVPMDDAFLVRAAGENAPAHGVRIGDLVLVKPSSRAKDGDVVIVRSAGALLVRAMTRRGSLLHLAAPGEGVDVELGQRDDYVVLGVLGGVIRME
ncbi:MAG: S24 family peptidase, partial [Gemmatimonadales bacterium]